MGVATFFCFLGGEVASILPFWLFASSSVPRSKILSPGEGVLWLFFLFLFFFSWVVGASALGVSTAAGAVQKGFAAPVVSTVILLGVATGTFLASDAYAPACFSMISPSLSVSELTTELYASDASPLGAAAAAAAAAAS